jgi:hypothetical protein
VLGEDRRTVGRIHGGASTLSVLSTVGQSIDRVKKRLHGSITG